MMIKRLRALRARRKLFGHGVAPAVGTTRQVRPDEIFGVVLPFRSRQISGDGTAEVAAAAVTPPAGNRQVLPITTDPGVISEIASRVDALQLDAQGERFLRFLSDLEEQLIARKKAAGEKVD